MDEENQEKFMFDTNVFGDLVDEYIDDLSVDSLEKNEKRAIFYITHIQRDEIRNIGDDEFRKKLLKILETFSEEEIPTEGAVTGISEVEKCKTFPDDSELYDRILCDLPGKNLENDKKDALIATTALENDITLVTADGEGNKRGLQDTLDEIDKPYMSRAEFIRWLEDE